MKSSSRLKNSVKLLFLIFILPSSKPYSGCFSAKYSIKLATSQTGSTTGGASHRSGPVWFRIPFLRVHRICDDCSGECSVSEQSRLQTTSGPLLLQFQVPSVGCSARISERTQFVHFAFFKELLLTPVHAPFRHVVVIPV